MCKTAGYRLALSLIHIWVRAFLGYMMAHPGGKLLFMGQEFGQFIEWDYKKELDWILLGYEMHQKLKTFVATLNKFYLESSPLWEDDHSWNGFQWISNDDYTQNIISFRRMNLKGEELVVVCNFSPVLREDYRIGAPYYGTYTEIFSTNDERFGGTGCDNPAPIHSEDVPGHGYEQSISLTVSPMSVMFFRVDKEERPKEEKTVKKASGRVPKTKQAKVDE